jgi:predicted CXXCH cytochrome family protein
MRSLIRRTKTPLILAFVLCLSGLPVAAFSASCFTCHDPVKFRNKVVHSPVKEKKCNCCHDPHVARYPGLLKKPKAQLCFGCHPSIEKKINQSKFLHQPVKEGTCGLCHEAHVAEYQGLMRKNGGEGCRECHQKALKNFPFLHSPYKQGQCDVCHEPHGSSDYRLLKAEDPGICLSCHKENSALKKVHFDQNLGEIKCLDCHNPHGGDSRSLIRRVRHEPFAKGNCRVCHDRPSEIGVCLGCHKDIISSFYKKYTHLQGTHMDNLCTKCHSPHASDKPALIPGSEGEVCRPCHQDTFSRREKMLRKHPGWNSCTQCHKVHGSNQLAMMKDEPDKVCARCHERHIKFVHPIGEEAIDPRDGQPMTCITCHDPCTGTMFQHQLRASSDRDLCIECHQGY